MAADETDVRVVGGGICGCRAVGVVADGTVAAAVCLPDRCIGKLVFTCIVISRRYHIFNHWLARVAHGAEQSGGKFEGRVKSKSIK